jgi:hypothetical protein
VARAFDGLQQRRQTRVLKATNSGDAQWASYTHRGGGYTAFKLIAAQQL